MSKSKRSDEDMFAIDPDRKTARAKAALLFVVEGLIRKATAKDVYALREKDNRLTVNGVHYDLSPMEGARLYSCYQNIKRKAGVTARKARVS